MADDTARQAESRAAVESLKGARASMGLVLERVRVLENALSSASSTIGALKGYISPNCYAYPSSSSPKKVHDLADAGIADIARVLA
jgi:hypothetical protein